MADYLIRKESNEILAQVPRELRNEKLLCSVIKVLQMRHQDIDQVQAARVVKKVLEAK